MSITAVTPTTLNGKKSRKVLIKKELDWKYFGKNENSSLNQTTNTSVAEFLEVLKAPVNFEEIPVEWKSPHSLDDLATKYVLKKYVAPCNPIPRIFGLEVFEWQKVFKFVSTYKDWKKCRLVCKTWNHSISTWSYFAEKTCLVFDGRRKVEGFGDEAKLSSFINDPKIIPHWQNLRFQFAKPSSGRFWLGKTLPFVSTLEFKNCILNWFDFMEILSIFKNLTSVSVILNKDVKAGPLKYFSLFVHGLPMDAEKKFVIHSEESKECPLIDFDTFDESIANVTHLFLDLTFIELANIFIQLFAKCTKIEEFRVTLHKDFYRQTPPEIELEKYHNFLLRTNDFLRNTGATLKILHIAFGPGRTNEGESSRLSDISEMTRNCALNLAMLQQILEVENGILNLEEFGLELGTFSIYGEKMKKILQITYEKLRSFIASQINLKKFILRDWTWANDDKEKSSLHALIPDSCAGEVGLFVLGGFKPPFCPNWADFEDVLVSIKIQWEICNIRRLRQIMPETINPMPKVKNLELLNNLPICFVNFDVRVIVSKFPNLTRLHLEDIDQLPGKQIRCVKGHRIENAQFHDTDLQLIFEHLQKLEVLYIKTRMYPVTDFAFTGVSPTEFRSMEETRSYKHDLSSIIGFQLSNLHQLKSLSLIGLSYKVTDITAFIAFEGGFLHLTFLDFVTSGFSKRARRFLKNKFGKREGFSLTIT